VLQGCNHWICISSEIAMRNNLRLIVWGSSRLSLFCYDACNTLEIGGTVQLVHAVTASQTGKVTRIGCQQGHQQKSWQGKSCSKTARPGLGHLDLDVAPVHTSRRGPQRIRHGEVQGRWTDIARSICHGLRNRDCQKADQPLHSPKRSD
jgi:hypothetical protein